LAPPSIKALNRPDPDITDLYLNQALTRLCPAGLLLFRRQSTSSIAVPLQRKLPYEIDFLAAFSNRMI
ncbi:hypothetical protein N8558_02710, partial [bacterium]|nr:hypothetical protein [bacterium]